MFLQIYFFSLRILLVFNDSNQTPRSLLSFQCRIKTTPYLGCCSKTIKEMSRLDNISFPLFKYYATKNRLKSKYIHLIAVYYIKISVQGLTIYHSRSLQYITPKPYNISRYQSPALQYITPEPYNISRYHARALQYIEISVPGLITIMEGYAFSLLGNISI